jgi:exodeoxyribonuclease VII small subunit
MPARSRTTPASADAGELSFEQSIEELDQIIQSLDGDPSGLDELVARYERGMKLLGHCQGQLDTAQLRIEQISRRADGQAETIPLAAPVAANPVPSGASPASPPPASSDDEIRLF